MYRDAKLLAYDAMQLTAGGSLAQRQDSLPEQLDDLVIVADRLGMRDAADAIRALQRPATVPVDAILKPLPYSEVCMHLRVAGKLMWVHRLGRNAGGAQLYDLEGQRFSAPITVHEAGLR